MTLSIGIDVHKDTLVVATPAHQGWTFARDDAGIAALVTLLEELAPAIVALEPSGGYERRVLRACWAADIPVHMVNGYQVRAWIRGEGVRAKTDAIDAWMLARFAEEKQLEPMTPPDAVRMQLRDLVRARRQVVAMVTALDQQVDQAEAMPRVVLEELVVAARTAVATLEQEIDHLLTTSTQVHEDQAIVASFTGIGTTTATMVLVEMPDLGTVSDKQASALLGVAPITSQSGRRSGRGHIADGRRRCRSGLWMPTLAAIRFNPVIRAFAARLKAEGKPGKVVVIACMHKIIRILNAMLRDRSTWDPTRAHA